MLLGGLAGTACRAFMSRPLGTKTFDSGRAFGAANGPCLRDETRRIDGSIVRELEITGCPQRGAHRTAAKTQSDVGSRPALHSLQTPNRARRQQGVSGPRIGSNQSKAASGTRFTGGNSKTTGGRSIAAAGGSPTGVAGGWAFGKRSTSRQHSGVCFCLHLAQQEAAALVSTRQMRTGEAASGISIPRQASRKAAISRRIANRGRPWDAVGQGDIPLVSAAGVLKVGRPDREMLPGLLPNAHDERKLMVRLARLWACGRCSGPAVATW